MSLSFSEAAWSAGIMLLLMAPGLLLLLLRSADVVLGGGPELDPILLLLEFDELFTEFAIVEFEVEVMVEAVVGLVGGAPKSSKSLLPSLNSKSNMSGLRSVMSWMRS